jgi:hypothetical protein
VSNCQTTLSCGIAALPTTGQLSHDTDERGIEQTVTDTFTVSFGAQVLDRSGEENRRADGCKAKSKAEEYTH